MATLEVVSKETFQQQLEGMASSCAGCQKERERCVPAPSPTVDIVTHPTQHRRSRRFKRSPTLVKRNSPIVVHLRDTIKVSVKNKFTKASPASSDIESDSSSEDSANVHVKSEPVPTAVQSQGYENYYPGKKQLKCHTHVPSTRHSVHQHTHLPHHHTHHQYHRQPVAGGKDLNAFLSAIEKVHSKDKGAFSANNLNQDTSSNKDIMCKSAPSHLQHTYVLNNSVPTYHSTIAPETSSIINNVEHTVKDLTSYESLTGKKLLDPSNDRVKLICNDLRSSSISSSENLLETSEDSEHSESSSVTSIYDSPSDSDVSTSTWSESATVSHDASDDGEFGFEEAEQLAAYTTGCPLMKYECPPHECPECIAAYYSYTHYYAQGSDLVKIEVLTPGEAAAAKANEYPMSDSDVSSESTITVDRKHPAEASFTAPDSNAHVTVTGPKRVDVSVAAILGTHRDLTRLNGSRSSSISSSSSSSSSASSSPQSCSSKHTWSPTHKHQMFETVTIDLSNSDISYTVSYHNEQEQGTSGHYSETHPATPDVPQATLPQFHLQHVPGYWDFYCNFYSTMMGLMPWMLPYCLYSPAMPPPTCPYSSPVMPVVWPPGPPSREHKEPKCLPKHHPAYGPSQDYFYKPFTASQPPQRSWLPLTHPDTSRPIAIYTVMCYNVLCDKYATRQLYGYCPTWALNWEYRKKVIIEEIRNYSADIISLQEVETEQFYKYFLPELKVDGYDGVFAPKSRARTMQEADRKHVDGCAIFFKTSKFSLVNRHLVEFNQLAINAAEGSHDMINRVMTKDNIGLAALLETKDAIWENTSLTDPPARQTILVATCHVHWDPEFCDVKLIQTMMLMSELRNLIEETQTSLRPGSSTPDSNSVPLILCGDLNSLPESGVVEYLNSGKVAANHTDFKDLGYEESLLKLSTTENKDIYTHSFKLSQAYSKDVMPYTNYTHDFKGVIDYIFYSRDFMRPLGLLGPLDQEWFRNNRVFGCPHPQIPSDHLPLLVEFEMANPSSPATGQASGMSRMVGGRERGDTDRSSGQHSGVRR